MAGGGPLTASQLEEFASEGFVRLERAFDERAAAACRDALWARMLADGISRDDAATWVCRHGIAEVYGAVEAPEASVGAACDEVSASSRRADGGARTAAEVAAPWAQTCSASNERLAAAVDQLVGPGRWERGSLAAGWWVIAFPRGDATARACDAAAVNVPPPMNGAPPCAPPWGADGRWHIDGYNFRRFAHSREVGLVLIALYSDVAATHGGTALARGSHRCAARALLRAGRAGLSPRELSAATRAATRLDGEDDVSPTARAAWPVAEAVGRAGDIYLCHPLLLHARSKHLGARGDAALVRFMAHPAVRLHAPLRVAGGSRAGDTEALTPVERAIANERANLEALGEATERFEPWEVARVRASGEVHNGHARKRWRGGAADTPVALSRCGDDTCTEYDDDQPGNAELTMMMGFGAFGTSKPKRRREP